MITQPSSSSLRQQMKRYRIVSNCCRKLLEFGCVIMFTGLPKTIPHYFYSPSRSSVIRMMFSLIAISDTPKLHLASHASCNCCRILEGIMMRSNSKPLFCCTDSRILLQYPVWHQVRWNLYEESQILNRITKDITTVYNRYTVHRFTVLTDRLCTSPFPDEPSMYNVYRLLTVGIL